MRYRPNPDQDPNDTDNAYEQFGLWRANVRAAKSLALNDPALKKLADHFWALFSSNSPTVLGRQTSKTVAVSESRGATTSRPRPIASATAAMGGNISYGTDPYTLRSKAFSNVMNAYGYYLRALAKTPTLSIEKLVNEAQEQMCAYGKNDGPGSLTIGLDYRELPLYYEYFCATVEQLADQAIEAHKNNGNWPTFSLEILAPTTELTSSGIQAKLLSPLEFMLLAQKALSQHAKDLQSTDRAARDAAQKEEREQNKALREFRSAQRAKKEAGDLASGLFGPSTTKTESTSRPGRTGQSQTQAGSALFSLPSQFGAPSQQREKAEEPASDTTFDDIFASNPRRKRQR